MELPDHSRWTHREKSFKAKHYHPLCSVCDYNRLRRDNRQNKTNKDRKKTDVAFIAESLQFSLTFCREIIAGNVVGRFFQEGWQAGTFPVSCSLEELWQNHQTPCIPNRHLLGS